MADHRGDGAASAVRPTTGTTIILQVSDPILLHEINEDERALLQQRGMTRVRRDTHLLRMHDNSAATSQIVFRTLLLDSLTDVKLTLKDDVLQLCVCYLDPAVVHATTASTTETSQTTVLTSVKILVPPATTANDVNAILYGRLHQLNNDDDDRDGINDNYIPLVITIQLKHGVSPVDISRCEVTSGLQLTDFQRRVWGDGGAGDGNDNCDDGGNFSVSGGSSIHRHDKSSTSDHSSVHRRGIISTSVSSSSVHRDTSSNSCFDAGRSNDSTPRGRPFRSSQLPERFPITSSRLEPPGNCPLPSAIPRRCDKHQICRGVTITADLALEEDSEGNVPAHCACANGNTDLVLALRRIDGKCLEHRNARGQTPIFSAAGNGHWETVSALMDVDRSLAEALDKEGKSAMTVAVEQDQASCIPILGGCWPEGLYLRSSTQFSRSKMAISLLAIAGYHGNLNALNALVQLYQRLQRSTEQLESDVLEAMYLAAQNDEVHVVEVLVTKWPHCARLHVWPNIVHGLIYGMTPTTIAAWMGSDRTLEVLIRYNPTCPQTRRKNGETSVWIAAQKGNLAVVSRLLAAWPDGVRELLPDGESPLYVASQNGHVEVVKFLLNLWPEAVNACTHAGLTPLVIATRNNHLEVVAELSRVASQLPTSIDVTDTYLRLDVRVDEALPRLSSDAAASAEGDGLLLYDLVVHGRRDALKRLLDAWPEGIHVKDRDGRVPVNLAATFGCIDIVRDLLARWPEGVREKDNHGKSSMFAAAENGHVDIFRVIAKQWREGIDEFDGDRRPLICVAAYGNHLQTVQLILELFPKSIDHQDMSGATAVFCAAEKGHTALLEFLLRDFPHVTMGCRKNGMSPIYVAAESGHTEAVRILLTKWPETVNQKTECGLTPICIAADFGRMETLSVMLGICPTANLDQCTSDGRTPLYLASKSGHADIVRLLFSKFPEGAQRNAVNGLNPFSIAVKKGRTDVVRALLEIDPESATRCDGTGRQPIFYAVLQPDLEILAMLITAHKRLRKAPIPLDNGALPIHVAVQTDGADRTMVLLGNAWRDCLHVRLNDGQTLLHIAARFGCEKNVSALIRYIPSLVSAVDRAGCLPIHAAARNRQIACYDLLQQAFPVSESISDNNGHTPRLVLDMVAPVRSGMTTAAAAATYGSVSEDDESAMNQSTEGAKLLSRTTSSESVQIQLQTDGASE